MAEVFVNPFFEEKKKILVGCRNNPSPEQEREIERLEDESRAFIQSKLAELGSLTVDVGVRVSEVKKEYSSARKQYKRACELYQEAVRVVESIRNLKKELRIELGITKVER